VDAEINTFWQLKMKMNNYIKKRRESEI